MINDIKAFTVTQINDLIRYKIKSDEVLSSVYVKGEISNLTYNKSGHIYFSLKDASAVLKCVLFSGNAVSISFKLENGMKIISHGSVSVYAAGGTYQLYIDNIIPDGVGALALAYEQLKNKLEKEGLFSANNKKQIPKYPEVIGVISSPSGAAVRDIINIAGRRFPYSKIVLFPSLVQGTDAPAQIISGIDYFDKKKNVDVIILARGGGSIEDLWAFNNESLIRKIYSCSIPVISAIGHETDYTLSDFVSDLRVPTPSAAGEMVVPDSTDLKRKLENLKKLLYSNVYNRYSGCNKILESDKRSLIDTVKYKKGSALSCFAVSKEKFISAGNHILDDFKLKNDSVAQSFENAFKNYLDYHKNKFSDLTSSLNKLSPLSVLSRGYCFAEKDGVPVSSINNIFNNDELTLQFKDGILRTVCKEKVSRELVKDDV